MYSAYDFNDTHFDICLPSFAFQQRLGAFGMELYGLYTILYIYIYTIIYYYLLYILYIYILLYEIICYCFSPFKIYILHI